MFQFNSDPSLDGRRPEISTAKRPFLEAILAILREQRAFWPLSDRQIHYRLLGQNAPLTHASKPDSIYVNDRLSYQKLCDLLSRGRINGLIDWEAIDDVTRPIDLHHGFRDWLAFFESEQTIFLRGYSRDLLGSQPHHVEIIAEKLTVRTILQRVAENYNMPLTISRGIMSLPPKKKIHDRYRSSKKKKLILLIVSDLDPAGDAIAEDILKSFRRDFAIENIEAYKVALTIEQVQQLGLNPSMEAKESSPTYTTFVNRYGITDAYELEAMTPTDLAEVLKTAIEQVIDMKLYKKELLAEQHDHEKIDVLREQIRTFIESLN